jgi:hypothetical protein
VALCSGSIFHWREPRASTSGHTALDLNFNVGALLGGLLRAAGFGIFCGSWITAAFCEDTGTLIALAIAATAGLFLWIDLFIRWSARKGRINHRRRTVRYGLRLLRESWLGWLALGSVLYFLTLLLALPLRNRADAALDRMIEVGEVAKP